MTKDVFVSHASDDAALATQLVAFLDACGIACFLAPRDVAPGAVWDEAVVDGIDACAGMVLILSARANESPFVKNEINRAFSNRKTIFAFRTENIEAGKSLQLYLARHQWIDAFPPPVEAKFGRLAQAIGQWLGRPIGEPALALAASGVAAAAIHGSTSPDRRPHVFRRITRSLDKAVTVRRRSMFIAWAGVFVLGAIGAAVVSNMTRPAAPPPRVSRFLITPPSAAALTITGTYRDVAITPDGTRVVYIGANGTMLFVRALDQLDATALSGLGAPLAPFVSPDGQWIGFADANITLKKVAITGGPAVTLARLDGNFRGATWAPDGTIVFATTDPTTGLQRFPAGGGEPTVLTRPDRARGEVDHFWPEILPGGQAVLFTITATTGGLDQAQIAVFDLRTGTQTTLIRGGSDAHYVPSGSASPDAVHETSSGHLVYGASGTLRAVGFDLARLAVVGTPVPVVPQVVTTAYGAVDVAVAGNGTLVYVPGVGTAVQRTLVWVDRQGQETPIAAPPHAYDLPRISPDGVRVAVHALDEENDIWLLDLVRGALTRLTFEPAIDFYPVWSPDGRRLFFSSAPGAQSNLFKQATDGTGAVERLTESPNSQRPNSISPDGTRLVFTEVNLKTGNDVMQLRLDGAQSVTPLVQTGFAERNGEVSPDGRWLAYEANDSGTFEIHVRPFPDVAGGRSQVSTGGGRQPLWARSGQELFYFAPTGALMRVGVAREAAWAATTPAKLFEGRYYTGIGTQAGRMYDIAPDGQRFLMIKPGAGSESTPAPTSLVVIQHFDEELRRLVPLK